MHDSNAGDGRTVTLADLVCLLLRASVANRGTDVLIHAFMGSGEVRDSVTEGDVSSLAWLAPAIPDYTRSAAEARSLARHLGVAVESEQEGRGWRSRSRDAAPGGDWPTSVVGRTESLALMAALAAHLRTRGAASAPAPSSTAR